MKLWISQVRRQKFVASLFNSPIPRSLAVGITFLLGLSEPIKERAATHITRPNRSAPLSPFYQRTNSDVQARLLKRGRFRFLKFGDSRRAVARLSNTNDASFCAAALEEAVLRFGKPLTLPSGLVKIGDTQYTVRTNAMPVSIADLNNIPIKYANGQTVFIKDVGQAHDGWAVQQNIVREDGRRSVLLSVLKNGGASTLAVVDGVRKVLK